MVKDQDYQDREIIGWFMKPIMRSAIKYMSRDAVVALIRAIASEWNAANGATAEVVLDGRNIYKRFGPDVLLMEAISDKGDYSEE